jgi:hypothetical protein
VSTKRVPPLVVDVAAFAAFLACGGYLTWYLLADPTGSHVAGNRQDSVQLQWLLSHATRLLTHGENPLTTTLINSPHGVNLMANTSILALALPLTPVTLALGPGVSAALLLTLAPAVTAAAWYYVLSRHLVSSRLAAFVGALFAGFSPAMVSHDVGHPNIVMQPLLPLIVLTVLRLRIPGRAVRTGLELAVLVVLQVFINEEILFLTAMTIGLFLLAMLIFDRKAVTPHVRSALIASGVTTVVAGAVLAYPLWYQFFGPMAYHGLPTFVLDYGADLASFPAFATESLAGPAAEIARLAPGPTEENAFFGWPLLVLLVVAVGWQWRANPTLRSLAVTGLLLAALSLGSTITIAGERTEIPGPWTLLANAPLFDSVVPTRLAMFLTPIVALLLALTVEAIHRAEVPWPRWRRGVRWAAAAGFALALVPIAPTPIEVDRDRPTPVFFTSGIWRGYLPAGAHILPVPLGWDENVDVMQWQLAVNCEFVTLGGYFLAPVPGSEDRRARFGPAVGPTSALLDQVASSTPAEAAITQDTRDRARRELTSAGVDALVLPDGARGAEALRTTVDDLLGRGTRVADVWLWDVR